MTTTQNSPEIKTTASSDEEERGILSHLVGNILNPQNKPSKPESSKSRTDVLKASKEGQTEVKQGTVSRMLAFAGFGSSQEILASEVEHENTNNKPKSKTKKKPGNLEKTVSQDAKQVGHLAKEGEKIWDDEKKLGEVMDGIEEAETELTDKDKPKDSRPIWKRAEEEWERFLDKKDEKTGDLRVLSFGVIARKNWEERKGLFSFFWQTFKDYWKYRAVKRSVSFINKYRRLYFDAKKRWKGRVEKVWNVIKSPITALKTKKKLNEKASAVMVTGKEVLNNMWGKTKGFVRRIVKGDTGMKTPKEMLKNLHKQDMDKLRKLYNQAGKNKKKFRKLLRRRGVFSRIVGGSIIFELTTRSMIKLNPFKRGESDGETWGQILTDVTPGFGTYEDWKRLQKDDNWMNKLAFYSSAGADGLLLWWLGSMATTAVGSGGILAIPAGLGALGGLTLHTLAKIVGRVGMKGISKKLAKKSAQKLLQKGIKPMGSFSAKEFAKKIPQKLKSAILNNKVMSTVAMASVLAMVMGDETIEYIEDKGKKAVEEEVDKLTQEEIHKMNPTQKRAVHYMLDKMRQAKN